MSDDEHFGRQPRPRWSVPSTPWSKHPKYVNMTEQEWYAYHSAWIVCFKHDCCHADHIDVFHMERARPIVFG